MTTNLSECINVVLRGRITFPSQPLFGPLICVCRSCLLGKAEKHLLNLVGVICFHIPDKKCSKKHGFYPQDGCVREQSFCFHFCGRGNGVG
ncbi:hypothetical protein AHAS_Ahas17G0104400 [Arachis hypogaea]